MIMIKIYTLAKENDDILYMSMSLLGPGGGGDLFPQLPLGYVAEVT